MLILIDTLRHAIRRSLNSRLKSVRTHKVLKADPPSAGAEALVAQLSDEDLVFAAQNPDHSEAGRALAFRTLANKMGPEAAELRMEAFVNALPTPGYFTANDIAKNDWIFFGLGRWIRVGLGLLAALATIAFLAYFVYMLTQPAWTDAISQGLLTQTDYDTWQAMTEGADKDAREAELMARPGVAELVGPYEEASDTAAEYVLWAWLIFPVWALVTGMRRKPARVLLLRKFNNKEVGKSLEKLSKRNLRTYGHVFTLADKHFKRNWIYSFLSAFWASPLTLLVRVFTVPIGFVHRFFDRSRNGPILIWNSNDFKHFAKRFEDRWGLNLEVARTQRKAVMVRTSDTWWQHVVELIMHAVDVIVIDLTQVAAGTVWELRKVPAEDVGERVVFTCRDDRLDAARQELTIHGYGAWIDQIQVYDKHGKFHDHARFRSAMRHAMQRRLARPDAQV